MINYRLRMLAVVGACLVSACSSSGLVGTYDCPRAGAINQLELADNGKATWTYLPQGNKVELRYEAKENDVRLFRLPDSVAPVDTSRMGPGDKWRVENRLKKPLWHFQFHEGNLQNLVDESESCTRK